MATIVHRLQRRAIHLDAVLFIVPIVTFFAVFTRPLDCHETEQDDRHDSLPAERATGLDGGAKDFRIK